MTRSSVRTTTPPAAPAVAVIIPARNAAATLGETLASLQAQQFRHWQAIVVDDGSTDATADIALQHARHDPRIQCLQGPQAGVSAARNFGVRHCAGPVLAFLDADDLWLPGKLRAHLAQLQRRPEVGLSFDRIRFVDAAARPTAVTSTRRVKGLPRHAFLYENPACTASTLVFRRRAFVQAGGFDETLNHAEDLELMLRLRCTTDWQVEGLDQVLTHYRANSGGASADLLAMQQGWERVMARARRYAPDLLRIHLPRARAVHLRYLARRALRLGLPAAAGLALWRQAMASSPLALARDPARTLGTLAGLLWHGTRTRLLSTPQA